MRHPFWPRSIHIPIFFLVYVTLLVVPLTVLFLLKQPLMGLFGVDWWIVPFSVTMASALITPLLYVGLLRKIQEQILERQKQYQQKFLQAAQGMTLIKEMRRLLNLVVHILTRIVGVEQASLWLLEKKSERFVLQAFRGALGFDGDHTIGINQPLVQHLAHQKDPIVREGLRAMSLNGRVKYLQPIAEEMDRIGAAIIIPSFAGEKLLGFIALGPKKSKQPYSGQDLEVFEVMASQAALAIENAQFYEELQRTQTDLFQTAKMASLGYMAGGMSHQINNRFHVLTILAGTLRSDMKDVDPLTAERERVKKLWDKALDTLTKLEDNALRGGDIVKTLLRFSRPPGEYKPITIKQILSTAWGMAQFRVDSNTMDYTEQAPDDLPSVKGDLNQLADCCFNLITNAHDAIQKKAELIQGKSLPPGPEDPSPFRGRLEVRVKAEQADGKRWVILEFKDNGIGMSPQELESLFVPFFTTKATSQKGTGLGLYVIQRIIERYGGEVTAGSKYGVGTSFVLRIPAFQG